MADLERDIDVDERYESESIPDVGMVDWRVMQFVPGQFCLEVVPREARWAQEKHGELVSPVLRIPIENDDPATVAEAKSYIAEGLETLFSSSQ